MILISLALLEEDSLAENPPAIFGYNGQHLL